MSETAILLAGASRGVGREIAVQLREQGYNVVAILRSPDAESDLTALGVKVAYADAFEPATLEKVFSENLSLAAVISTLGGVSPDGRRVDDLGNIHLIDATVKAGIQRFILISSIGTGNSAVALPPQVLETLKPALIAKEKAEQHLVNSGLNYTIIRPGGLKSEPATGQGILTENIQVAGMIHRADVAQLTCQSLYTESTYSKIVSAVDRKQRYGDFEVEAIVL